MNDKKKPEMVDYRGTKMVSYWPDRIKNSQLVKTCVINDAKVNRIPYGVVGDNLPSCRDCAVIAGELHVPYCDVERCPVCGGQLITCKCDLSDEGLDLGCNHGGDA